MAQNTQMHLQQGSYQHAPSHSLQPSWGGPFPNLHLWPIQETFSMKMIHLPEGQRIKIGRQTNHKSVPSERNAFFDSKVLSRVHAEVWEQNGKIYIKDVKSSNGTFVNQHRLSIEAVESEPYELNTEDIVEFGIDIVADDNRSILHHKVSAKVYCCFGPEDAAMSARELVHYQDNREIRRPAAPSQGPAPLQANVLSSGGKASGLSFDHVLNKLQIELQKSKEAGVELQGLTTAMNEIQDTLGGGLAPTQNGSAAQYIPPQYRSMSAEAQAALTGPHGQQAAAFISLQNQLGETQQTLSTQLDKIQLLEGRLGDQASLRTELATLREQMENGRREMDDVIADLRERSSDDDARSVVTLMDSDDARERVRQRREAEQPDERDDRLQSMSVELADAVQTSRSLQSQQLELVATVQKLTERIGMLEDGVAGRIAEEIEKAEKKWDVWRAECESEWKKERQNWEAERERLRGVVREWEEASRRGHEEVEERELNERLSGDDFDDDDDGEPDEAELVVMDPPARGSGRRVRRRRPSHRTALAVRALKSVADETGAATPKAEAAALDAESRVGKPRRKGRRNAVPRNASSGTLVDKESSESGRDSGDTLKEERASTRGKRAQKQATQHPIPIVTVIMVAVVAGALYYRHKD